MNIGKRMRERRKEVNLTLEDVAKRTGVCKATISKYEKEQITNIPADKIEKISMALRCSPAYLMGWDDYPTDASKLMALYEKLNNDGRNKLLDYADDLVQSKKYTERDLSEVV